MPIDVYGVGGYKNVQAGALRGKGVPSSNFKGNELGQFYFDTSVSPAVQYTWNGQTWVASSSFASITSAGDITLTAGNVVINGAGNRLSVHGGAATDFIGTATLVAGTVTVANTNITTADRIMVTRNALNASPALGFLIVTINAGVGFTVASFSAAGAAATTDVSGFAYTITRQV